MSVFPEPVSAPLCSTTVVPITAADGARSDLLCVQGDAYPSHAMFWVPAMGVAAKHYLPLAEAFAMRGVAVALHEWRGIGSSDRRASRRCNWGYRQLLDMDLEAGVLEARKRWPQAPLWLGGHSLGGQLACLYASLRRHDLAGLALVASGAPYWRRFARAPLILAAYALVLPLSKMLGYLPGRRIGFGGNEARGVIADWSRSGRTGRYSAHGMSMDFERQLSSLRVPVLALRLRDDWLGPSASLEWLLDKMPHAPRRIGVLAPEQLAGAPADHFAWMKAPDGVAGPLAAWMAETSATRP